MTTKQAAPAATTQALATRQEAAVAPFQPENFIQAADMAARLSRSNLIPSALRGKPDDVLIVLLTGRELGLSVMQSLGGIHVIEGKPAVSAEMLSALVLSHPDVVEAFEPKVMTAERCVWLAKRRGRPAIEVEFTIEEARNAGLVGKDNWRKYPKAMLAARARKMAAVEVFPDLTRNILTEDEIDEVQAAASRGAPPTFVPPPQPAKPPRQVEVTVAPAEPPAEEEGELVEPLPGEEEPPAESAPLTDEEKIAGWLSMIANAANIDELRQIGQELATKEPKGSPVRDACQAAYSKRSAELRRSAQ